MWSLASVHELSTAATHRRGCRRLPTSRCTRPPHLKDLKRHRLEVATLIAICWRRSHVATSLEPVTHYRRADPQQPAQRWLYHHSARRWIGQDGQLGRFAKASSLPTFDMPTMCLACPKCDQDDGRPHLAMQKLRVPGKLCLHNLCTCLLSRAGF